MRELTNIDLALVSGGISCIDAETWGKVQAKATSDAMTFAALLTPIAGVITYVASDSVLASIGVGVVAMPYLAAAGFYYSSAWDIF